VNNKFDEFKEDTVLGIIASYVLSGVSCVIGFFLWFRLRDLVNVLLIFSPLSSWSYRIIEISTFMIFGIAWLTMAFYSQHLYQEELREGWIFKKFELITAWELLPLFLCNLIMYILVPVRFAQNDLKQMTAQCVVGILFTLMYFRKGENSKNNNNQAL
jgi:hypothetical protein